MTLYSLPPFLTLLFFIALAAVTIFRWRTSKINLLFLLICILGAGLYSDILFIFNAPSARQALLASRLDQFFSLFLIPLYVHFFHVYLGLRNRKWLVGVFYAVPGVLIWFGMTPLLIESMHQYAFGYFGRAGKLYPLVAISAVCATAYGGWIMGQAIIKSEDRGTRRRLKYLFAGFVSMAVLTGLNFFPLYGYPLYPPGNFCFIPLLVFAVGLFRHDLLNMGLLIKRGLVYALLAAALAGLYAVIVVGTNRLSGTAGLSSTVVVHLTLFMVIVFVYGPLKAGIRTGVDRFFGRCRYDYRRVVRQNSRMVAAARHIEELAGRLLQTVVHAMGVPHCLLYIRTGQGDQGALRRAGMRAGEVDNYPESIESMPSLRLFFNRRKTMYRKSPGPFSGQAADSRLLEDLLGRCDALLAVPLLFQGALNGLIVVGEKMNGEPYLKEDMDLLETLAGHGALAVENALAYQEIKRLNRNLEKRVAERTRKLQAALKEKERTLEQLIRSESLAAIGQLVAGVAHELNNPLASVKSLLQSVLEDFEQAAKNTRIDADLLDDLHFADCELNRASGIVSSLLGLSRQTQTYREPVDLNSVLTAALRVLANKVKRLDVDIRQRFAAALPPIAGNFSNLGQVAINIIGNAIDALPSESGVIELVTAYRAGNGDVMFVCRDNGSGMPEDLRREIFKPFFTTKPVGRGTGLGLYICHEIISRHGGSISVDSSSGKGARVEVRLPVNPTASIDIGQTRH